MSNDDLLLADFLTEQKLAEQLGCHERTVARWRFKRKGPRFTVTGRRVIYHKTDVNEWLRSGGTAPQTDSKRARSRRG